jgi:putative hemolysin
MLENFIILGVLLILSGLFSGSETALVALSMARAESLKKEGRRGAEVLCKLKGNTSRMLITILIGNNIVNIAASAIATVVSTQAFGAIGPGIAVGLLTLFILIFGEITPKSFAARNSERISLLVAPLIYGFMRLILPLVWVFELFTNWVDSKATGDGEPSVTEVELITMVEHGEKEGVIEADERQMIERVFIFNDLKAEDVMTPRGQVFRLDGNRTVSDLLPEIVHESFSRIPLFSRSPDEITGILMLRDVLHSIALGQENQRVIDLAQEPLYIPANMPIDELIVLLRKNRRHLAIVVDEHGEMLGVVTLEDMLEELVGEIYDETDEKPQEIMRLDGHRILVDATAELRVIEEHFARDLPGKPTDTVNRWLLDYLERIPAEGEVFDLDGFHIKIQGASSRMIEQVIIGEVRPAMQPAADG